MTTLLSKDKTRAIDDAPVFGIACYEGSVEGDQFNGTHVGVLGTYEDAERWLETGEPTPLRVHRTGTKPDNV